MTKPQPQLHTKNIQNMGKKGRDKKKGKGAEKTAAKTEKKVSNRQKKELAAIGEDDIEKIIADIEKEDKKRQRITETSVEPPSRRVNFSFIAHPDKEELILFGGEFFNGQKTFVYNDFFIYNIAHNQWIIVKAPGAPPPRCGHQMVATSTNKGQLWLFGGEFASTTQSQFYHYRDLWVFHVSTKKWEKINAPNGPTARSGHRMVLSKKQIFVFGGYHDNLRDYKYFNDIYMFNLETYTWTKLDPTGTPPAPRSACNMVALNDGRIVIYGGYSKEKLKKDVDKGHVYNDMYALTPDKHDATGLKYKWIHIKNSGVHISPRCGMTITVAPNNNAYSYGGVFDVEEDEEDITGTFFNDLHALDLEKLNWRLMSISGKRDKTKKKKKDDKSDDDDADDEDNEVTMEIETPKVVADDGIFTVTVGPTPASSGQQQSTKSQGDIPQVFQPSPRMNCGLAVKHGNLYLYGGMVEDGAKQLTLCDFYSLDLRKMEEWKTLVSDDLATQEWVGSDSESGSDESGSDSEEESESDEDSPMDTE